MKQEGVYSRVSLKYQRETQMPPEIRNTNKKIYHKYLAAFYLQSFYFLSPQIRTSL